MTPAIRHRKAILFIGDHFFFSLALWASLFFFIFPYFCITPKTLLVIYLAVSFLLVLAWRAFIYPWLGLQKTENALLVGYGREMEQLRSALNQARQAPARIAETLDPDSANLADEVQSAIRTY